MLFYAPFDYAQGDCQTERSPRLTEQAGKSGFSNKSTLITNKKLIYGLCRL